VTLRAKWVAAGIGLAVVGGLTFLRLRPVSVSSDAIAVADGNRSLAGKIVTWDASHPVVTGGIAAVGSLALVNGCLVFASDQGTAALAVANTTRISGGFVDGGTFTLMSYPAGGGRTEVINGRQYSFGVSHESLGKLGTQEAFRPTNVPRGCPGDFIWLWDGTAKEI
jgi:hypothetical protein